MLCPCCGAGMQLGARECSCGARIVGDPLGETPFKVKRFGPVMAASGMAAAAAVASIAFSIWAATSLVVVVFLSFRATKLSKQNPDLYGGRRVAATVLVTALTAGGLLLAYAGYRFPEFLENRQIRQRAQTMATMYHVSSILADYKSKTGSYPTSPEAMRKLLGGDLPADYWDQAVRYKSYTFAVGSVQRVEGASAASLGGDDTGDEDGLLPSSQDFELRSAGPDGIMGTADDIVMRDGVFYTDSKILKEPMGKDSPYTK